MKKAISVYGNTKLERLAFALEQAGDSIFITNRKGIIEYANSSFTRMTGYSAKEVVGKTPKIVQSGTHNKSFYDKLWKTILSGNVFRGIFINRKRSGELYYEDQTITPLKDAEGKITHFISTGRDVTDRKLDELQITLQYSVARILATAGNLSRAAQNILRVLGSNLGWNIGMFWLYDKNKDQFYCREIWHHQKGNEEAFRKEVGRVFVGTEGSVLGRVYKRRIPLWINNITKHKNYNRKHIARKEGMKDALFFPVFTREKTYGVVEFNSNEIRKLDRKLVQTVLSIGIQIGQFMVQREAQKKLQQSEERYRTLVQTTPDAIMVTDMQSCITNANVRCAELLGYSDPQEIIGKKTQEFVVKESLEYARKKILPVILKQGIIKNFEAEFKKKNGETFPAEIGTSLLRDDDNRPRAFISVFRDISKRKEEDARKDSLIGFASHELKTPLTSLKAFTELLQRRLRNSEDDKSKYYLTKINNKADELTHLINDFLDLNKIKAGRMQLFKERVDLNKMINKIVDDLTPLFQNREILKDVKVKKTIQADPQRIAQVLSNLITNALKYSPDNKPVIVHVKQNGKLVNITVEDFGMGIPKREQKEIFKPFYRTREVKTKNISGLGLGLFLAAEIIRLHRGRIEVESQPRKGSKFLIELPV